jgi:predicted kinase
MENDMKKLRMTLIRGVPGSGKTTKALEILEKEQNTDHWEADMFFERDGEYKFNPRLLGKAHAWCQKKTKESLKAGRNVIVANTFIKKWELEPYLLLAVDYNADVNYITCTGNYKNIHGVPEDKVESMRNNLEGYEEAIRVKKAYDKKKKKKA